MTHRVYLSLGSNYAARSNLQGAINLLSKKTRLIAVSSVYKTAPIGTNNPNSYFNAAVILETELEAAALKATILRPTEAQLGRKWGEGITIVAIDLDISLFDDAVFQLGKHQIPDPDILTRAYVAIPLADVAPDYIHPGQGKTLAEIARLFQGQGGIEKCEDILLKIK